MNNPCPIKIQCGDYPVMNLSSEGPEPFWLPPRGAYWTAKGYCCDYTMKYAFSDISQAAAERALTEMLETACPDCQGSEKSCADVKCADGTVMNTICISGSQAQADELAANLAAEIQPFCQQFCANAVCPDGTPLGTYCSSVSQADADAIAANFQTMLLPFCPGPFYYADARCANGTFLGTYASPISQADADALAAAAVVAFSDLCNDLFSSTCACPDGVTDVHTVYSTDSQAAADAQCAAIPKDCGPSEPGPDTTAPVITNGNVPNEQQCCVSLCPDGSQFAYCIPAGTVYDDTLIHANLLAYAFACLQAQANKTCMGSLSASFFCQNAPTSTAYVSASGTGPFTWAVTSGSLPTGMTLGIVNGNTAMIWGTPTTTGAFTFSLRATNAAGSYMQKSFTIYIVGFVTTSPLPDGTVGTAYSQSIQATGGSGNYQYTISAGALPTGLSMDAAGQISGTPTVAGDYTFTVLVEDSTLNLDCTKEFTLTINAPAGGCGALTIWAYYQCEASPDTDLAGTHHLTPLATAPTIAAGKIGNAFETSNFFGWIMRNSPGVGTTDWDFSGSDFAIRFWHYIPSTALVTYTTLFGTANPGFTTSTLGFVYGNLGGGGTNYYTFRVAEPVTGIMRSVNVAAPVVAGWHYVIGWFKKGVEIGIHVDTVASVTNATVLAMKSETGLQFAIYNPFSPPASWRFDEIAIWKCVPSEAQIVTDYNGGAGKTYPNIIGI